MTTYSFINATDKEIASIKKARKTFSYSLIYFRYSNVMGDTPHFIRTCDDIEEIAVYREVIAQYCSSPRYHIDGRKVHENLTDPHNEDLFDCEVYEVYDTRVYLDDADTAIFRFYHDAICKAIGDILNEKLELTYNEIRI